MAVSKQMLKKPSKAQQIADKEAGYARKDASLHMRVSSQFLDDIKQAAQAEGFDKYQAWVSLVLLDAVLVAKGIPVSKG